jgi:hypothetical protein
VGKSAVNDLTTFDNAELLQAYEDEAIWFWFAASTAEKSLEAGLHRLAARCILYEIRRRGVPEPDADLVYARARRTIPLDDLRRRQWLDRTA